MPARLRAAELRTDMERATGSAAEIDEYPTHLRVSVPAPVGEEIWQALLGVLASADRWGSSDASGQVRVWASVTSETAPLASAPPSPTTRPRRGAGLPGRGQR
ncbi:hypothetical protein [Streptomyces sp. S.PB5]|uniref:hypothetical protein n=1 Tax=Streptomyces sp. S.PB5 TaxID=3020844 RepID=UPI0025B0016D|nr:hypothetical protein [Streptomyces sp. S.PB5]MDN3023824.1 hypothetical protein [Streptomyces sp. S.PB5]